METSVRVPLRIGILIKSSSQRGWVQSLVGRLSEVGYTSIELVIFTSEAEPNSFITRLIHKNQYLLFSLNKLLDQAWFARRANPSKLLSVEELIKAVPILRLQGSHNNGTGLFSQAELQQVRSFDLDVVLCLAECLPSQQDCDVSRYGLWTLEDMSLGWPDSDSPVGFWEVIKRQPVTRCSLRVWSGTKDKGNIISQSFISTNPDSVVLNRSNYFTKLSAIVLRELRLLWEENGPGFQQKLRVNSHYDNQLPKNPTNRRLMIPLLQHYSLIIRRRIETRLLNHQWFLAFSFQDTSKGFGKLNSHYTEIVPPSDRFWADPFPVYRDGKYYLFFEELFFRSGKGHLSVTELHEDGTWTTPKEVLNLNYHLSYPFVFNWQDSYYMIPETNQKKSIELYECTDWPHKWKVKEVLMSGVNASDTTICEIEGLWWMFTAIAVEGTQVKDELFLYYSESPLGPWFAHKKNPVVSDARNARPAGRLFQSNGIWMRPTQDCSRSYGGAIAIMEIVRINPYEYVEKESVRIEPQWSKNLIGTHTWNIEGSLSVIDGCRRRLKQI